MGALILKQETSIATPPAGALALYTKTAGGLYVKDSGGVESLIGTNGLSSTKTGAYVVVPSDHGKVIVCDAAGGAFTVTLSPAATLQNGFEVTILKINADTFTGTNAVTIDADSTETINGALVNRLQTQYSFVTIVCNGSNFYVKNSNDALYANNAGGMGLSTATTWTNITSCSFDVPPGEWDLSGIILFGIGTGVANSNFIGAISSGSGTTTTDHVIGDNVNYCLPPTSVSNSSSVIPQFRVVLTTTTTYYLKANVGISSGSVNIFGRLSGRRRR